MSYIPFFIDSQFHKIILYYKFNSDYINTIKNNHFFDFYATSKLPASVHPLQHMRHEQGERKAASINLSQLRDTSRLPTPQHLLELFLPRKGARPTPDSSS